ncbi:signal transduction histidine kinase [Thiohalobacter thiocyanaticus]|uniref:histidine kinase n=1 Tax=Thiohalobacter thiocyanaticus TaxID=585455 RepID=A0A1Z4VTP9_9GAMM|nr:ATP-binding protein [Thiohalobacter thiocyanaticus]BAZ95011.1 signal transduction histidine kinase [Thiohalobacter thiocyanaticus]
MKRTGYAVPSALRNADRQDSLTWKPLRFLTLYRLVLAALLVLLFFLLPGARNLGSDNPWLYAVVSLGYFLFALVVGFSTRLRRPGFQLQVLLQITVDILAIVLLMYASGGLDSGLGILLVLAVIAGAMLMPGRMAFFFAAVATLALMAEFAYRYLTYAGLDSSQFTRVGLLGITLFTAASLAWLLAKRIRESEALAEQRGVDLANLARLNEYIVQRLQSGIVVVDHRERIRLINDAAWVMLQIPTEARPEGLTALSPELAGALRTWQQNPGREPEAFQPPRSEAVLQPRFTRLGSGADAATLIYLEDTALMAQQAQQMKLAALGRLTASIAHEIRNPLGAISHADQLLGESPNLGDADQRLVEIIASHADRVNGIVENVLQLSRRGTTQPQRLLLADWLNEFVDDMINYQNLDSDTVTVDIDPVDLQIEFDPGQLNQLTCNLIQNALNHGSRSGQTLEVKLVGRISESGAPCLDVIDNGPGIDSETLGSIFEPFFTTSASGTGLGLYLARELAEINRARLNHIEREEGGSCFRITFARVD